MLTRRRLVDWIGSRADARLILISAEAGYGKSTLLCDYALHGDRTCVWYRLESSDRDWITFLSYLVAAFQTVEPDFGRSTEALLRNVTAVGATRDFVLGQFLADLGTVSGGELDLVLDDYHVVEHSADVRAILDRLLERGPEGLRVLLAGRGRPDLALGRLLAQGRVAELTIDDLRFTKDEIEDLFATAYRQPLDREASNVVADRTEGWAASLQLVSASIASSRPGEVPDFIDALDGAKGPIYDFLAEEVLTRLSAATERVLVHASLLDRVRPELVSAAMSVIDDPPDTETVLAAVDDAEALGLLVDRAAKTGGRIHPLFRQFLAHQLQSQSAPQQARAMHHAIAVAAESVDWLVAARHYVSADEPSKAMRVLAAVGGSALGTGRWIAANDVLELMPETPRPPSVEVIRARALITRGRPDEAVRLLDAIPRADLQPDDQALVSLIRASAAQSRGDASVLWKEVGALQATGHSDPVVQRLADAWALMGTAVSGGPIGDSRRALERLAKESGDLRRRHFEAIALHNAATAALAQGDYAEAIRLAKHARVALAESPADASVVPSTQMVEALAVAESGDIGRGWALASDSLASPEAHLDVVADASMLAAIRGDRGQADVLEQRLRQRMRDGPTELGTELRASFVQITRHLTEGEFGLAVKRARQVGTASDFELDGYARTAYLLALASALHKSPDAIGTLDLAAEQIGRQQAWRWDLRLRVVDASVRQDREGLGRWVEECHSRSRLAILELADLIAGSLHLLAHVPEAVVESITRYPERWRPVLQRRLEADDIESSHVAASLLSDYGTHEDAERLAAFERRAKSTRRPRLSRQLAHRVSPTLRVHDLGRTTYEVSGVEAPSSMSRRKAMSLLLFLAARPKQTATREQVMEALWPHQSPESATNSLHQTLHFVRRDIAPWRRGSVPVDYVPLDSEVVYLDPDLVQVDSVAFMRQATDVLGSTDLARSGPSIARIYGGRFAPEFEYEDWAADWRSLVHTQYLLLVQSTAVALVDQGHPQPAIELMSRAVEIDHLALDLRLTLIRALTRFGASDAAAEHYRHYTRLLRRELDAVAPTLEEVLEGSTDEVGF